MKSYVKRIIRNRNLTHSFMMFIEDDESLGVKMVAHCGEGGGSVERSYRIINEDLDSWRGGEGEHCHRDC